MKLFFKVHHKFEASISNSFRQSNTLAINRLLSKSASPVESETVIIRNEEEYGMLDLDTIGANFVNKRGLRNPPAGWLPGEIGVWISNILALKNFLQKRYSIQRVFV